MKYMGDFDRRPQHANELVTSENWPHAALDCLQKSAHNSGLGKQNLIRVGLYVAETLRNV